VAAVERDDRAGADVGLRPAADRPIVRTQLCHQRAERLELPRAQPADPPLRGLDTVWNLAANTPRAIARTYIWRTRGAAGRCDRGDMGRASAADAGGDVRDAALRVAGGIVFLADALLRDPWLERRHTRPFARVADCRRPRLRA